MDLEQLQKALTWLKRRPGRSVGVLVLLAGITASGIWVRTFLEESAKKSVAPPHSVGILRLEHFDSAHRDKWMLVGVEKAVIEHAQSFDSDDPAGKSWDELVKRPDSCIYYFFGDYVKWSAGWNVNALLSSYPGVQLYCLNSNPTDDEQWWKHDAPVFDIRLRNLGEDLVHLDYFVTERIVENPQGAGGASELLPVTDQPLEVDFSGVPGKQETAVSINIPSGEIARILIVPRFINVLGRDSTYDVIYRIGLSYSGVQGKTEVGLGYLDFSLIR